MVGMARGDLRQLFHPISKPEYQCPCWNLFGTRIEFFGPEGSGTPRYLKQSVAGSLREVRRCRQSRGRRGASNCRLRSNTSVELPGGESLTEFANFVCGRKRRI